MTPESIITLITAILGTGIITYFFNRRKSSAETESITVTTAMSMVKTMDIRLKSNDERLSKLEKENEILRHQLIIIQQNDAYIKDLELSNNNLFSQVSILTTRVTFLETSLHSIIDSIRSFLNEPNKIEIDNLHKLLHSIESKMDIHSP